VTVADPDAVAPAFADAAPPGRTCSTPRPRKTLAVTVRLDHPEQHLRGEYGHPGRAPGRRVPRRGHQGTHRPTPRPLARHPAPQTPQPVV